MWVRSVLGIMLFIGQDLAFSYQTQANQANRAGEGASASRRAFLSTTTVTVASVAFSLPALSADVKVTPLAHTFITSGGAAKPIRENDATRFFTNARVVYMFEGTDADPGLSSEVLDLTVKRKAGQGPGVTPGNVKFLSSSKDLAAMASQMGLDVTSKIENQSAVVEAAKGLPAGDVLIVGPISSGGTAADGKILADCAAALGTFVGGKTGGGIISVLLDGPRQGLKLEDGGYPASELLWYSLPKKS